VRVFAFEFFSGGGLAEQPLPAGLAREGDLMLTTLVGELADLPGVEVIASRDPRVLPIPGSATLLPLPAEDAISLYRRGVATADAAWPTASESGGMLQRLVSATLDAGKILLGCSPDAVRLATSKRATTRALHQRGIRAVPTFAHGDSLPPLTGPWVLKPDDGAGCEDTIIMPGPVDILARLAGEPGRLVAQPWIEGQPASLSLLCAGGLSRLLACNRQEIAIRGGRISLQAIQVNALSDPDGGFAALAGRIAAAVPGLWGYVGVDLVLTPDGPVVLEINPRLTTSYCGLRPALGLNTAGLVLELARTGSLPPGPAIAGVSAELRLEPSHVL
jgi:tyramine---L-glutamate ligase